MIYQLPKFKDYVGQPVRYYSPKADGHMQYVKVDNEGQIIVWTKNMKDNTAKLLSVEHIKQELRRLPANSFVMGECHCPGELSTEVPHMLCTGDERLRFSVFAAPMLAGRNLANDDDLLFVMSLIKVLGLDTVPVLKVIQGFDCTFRSRPVGSFLVARLLKDAITQKIEGWVLKNHHMSEWYKLKPVKSIDAFVLDVTQSDSDTYKGHMKALILGLYKPDWSVHDLGECGGGFTKAFKMSLPYDEMRGQLLNRIVEVAYDSITKHQKLRFPRFIRFRDDKNVDSCTTEQLS